MTTLCRNSWFMILIGVAAGLSLSGHPAAADGARKLPRLTEVERAAKAHFAAGADYQAGDLITRSSAKALMAELTKLGWEPSDADELVGRVPGEDEFLPTVLGTPSGKRFMRSISKYPDGYDRLDRMAVMPHGKKAIRDLIAGPDGYKLIQYMTSTAGGKEMGKMISRAPTGAGFNRPTGRIYTAAEIIDALRVSFERDVAGR